MNLLKTCLENFLWQIVGPLIFWPMPVPPPNLQKPQTYFIYFTNIRPTVEMFKMSVNNVTNCKYCVALVTGERMCVGYCVNWMVLVWDNSEEVMFQFQFYHHKSHIVGPGVAYWLRRCATSRTVPGSIPGGVTGFLSDIFPSDRSMALGSTQPLAKMSTRNIPGGKGGRCVRVMTSPPLSAEFHENLRA
jgi:hypothetical protein